MTQPTAQHAAPHARLPGHGADPMHPHAGLAREHRALLAQYGEVQTRCSAIISRQAVAIEQLQAEVLRLRAAVIQRDTTLALEREDRRALETAIPGLPKRLRLARRVEWLIGRVQDLLRERLGWRNKKLPLVGSTAQAAVNAADLREKSILCVGSDQPGASAAQTLVELAGGRFAHHPGEGPTDSAALEASLVAADLVICQTGCVSHDAYWRVQDHCRRTGKQCVLVDQPQAMQFVRSAAGAGDVATAEPASNPKSTSKMAEMP